MGNSKSKHAVAPVSVDASGAKEVNEFVTTKFNSLDASLALLSDSIKQLAEAQKSTNDRQATVAIEHRKKMDLLLSQMQKVVISSSRGNIINPSTTDPTLGRSHLTSSDEADIFFDSVGLDIDDNDDPADIDKSLKGRIENLVINGFDASAAILICESLNSVAGELPIVGAIISTMTSIFEKIDEAQANQELCDQLGVRIFELGMAVRELLTIAGSKSTGALTLQLALLKNKLVEAKNFVEEFSKRGWFMKMMLSSRDEETFQELDDDLSKIVSDAHLGVMGTMLSLQQKTYSAITRQEPRIARIKSEVAELGGVGELGRDMAKATKIAKEMGVDIEEIQSEAILEKTREIMVDERKEAGLKKILRHKGFRLFWMNCFGEIDIVSTDDFFEQLKIHLKDHLQLDKALVDELTTERVRDSLVKAFDEDGDGSISLLEMCSSVNNLKSVSNERSNDIASAIRLITKEAAETKACRFHVPHLKPDKVKSILGRDNELQVLRNSLTSIAQSENYHACEVTGAAGSGKTNFVIQTVSDVRVQEFYSGIFYVDIENCGENLDLAASTTEEVVQAIATAMYMDISSIEEGKKREFVHDILQSPKTNRILFVIDGISGKTTTDAVLNEIASIAGLAKISCLLVTTAPSVEEKHFRISTRVYLNNLGLIAASKLVASINPLLSKRRRKRVLDLSNGVPARIIELARLPETILDKQIDKMKNEIYDSTEVLLENGSSSMIRNASVGASSASSLDYCSPPAGLVRNDTSIESVDEMIDTDVYLQKFRSMTESEILVVRRLSLIPSTFTFFFLRHLVSSLSADSAFDFDNGKNLLNFLLEREWILRADNDNFRVKRRLKRVILNNLSQLQNVTEKVDAIRDVSTYFCAQLSKFHADFSVARTIKNTFDEVS